VKDLIGSVAVGVGAGVPVTSAAQGPSLVPWPGKVREFFPGVLGAGVGIGLAVGSQVSQLRGLRALAAGVGVIGVSAVGYVVAKNLLIA